LRVLHYTDELRLAAGGVVRAVLDLTAALVEAGAEVTLATGDPSDADAAATPVVGLDRRVDARLRPKNATADIERLVAGADVVHLHKPWDPLCLAFAAACRRAGKPYLVSSHGMLDAWCMASKATKKRVYLALVGRRFLEGAARVHFTTDVEAEQSMRRVPGMTPLVEPLVVDTSSFRELVGPEPARVAFPGAFASDGARLLFLGRLQAIKGLPTLIDALATLGDDAPHLIIAGPAEEAHDKVVAERAQRAGLGDRVHLLGMVGGDVKQSLYQAADAFVLPSHHENFGIALVEAMLCGAPVLTSRHVGIWREVERLGALVVDQGVEGFAGGVRRLLGELDQRKQAAHANRQAVFDWLDPAGLAVRYLDAYESAIAEAAKR